MMASQPKMDDPEWPVLDYPSGMLENNEPFPISNEFIKRKRPLFNFDSIDIWYLYNEENAF